MNGVDSPAIFKALCGMIHRSSAPDPRFFEKGVAIEERIIDIFALSGKQENGA
jgi:hypothetical protein